MTGNGTTTTYGYDPEMRLIQASSPGMTASYKYDPFGRRIETNVNGAVTRYLCDRQDVIADLDVNNQVLESYTHGPGIDEPLSTQAGGQKAYYHADGLGSVTMMTDVSDNIVQSYAHDSFGNILRTGNPNFSQPYAYAGREYDQETGFYYYRARYYDPMAGRFISEDPIRLRGGDLNYYRYVRNNPVNFYDPLGLIMKCIHELMLVTAYNDKGPGSDWAYYKPTSNGAAPRSVGPGTVAVANTNPPPYPYGANVTVFGPNGGVDYTGQVHDTGAGWDEDHADVSPDQWIDIWLPGNEATTWGKQWRQVKICYDNNCK
jgi:RHS repeat-associated protein